MKDRKAVCVHFVGNLLQRVRSVGTCASLASIGRDAAHAINLDVLGVGAGDHTVCFHRTQDSPKKRFETYFGSAGAERLLQRVGDFLRSSFS